MRVSRFFFEEMIYIKSKIQLSHKLIILSDKAGGFEQAFEFSVKSFTRNRLKGGENQIFGRTTGTVDMVTIH